MDATGRLGVVGTEWASYAIPVAGSGRRAVAKEVAEEASERLARQGVRGADEEWVRLYRAVSPEELEDIKTVGRLRQHPQGYSMEGKWFATTPEHAAMWAKKFLYRTNPYYIVEVRVRQSVLKRMIYRERLDTIGPAYYADPEHLPHIRYERWLPYIPWLR